MGKTSNHPNVNESINNDSPAKINRFIFHLHPAKISAASLKFSRTFGLGGISVLLIILQLFTGILLRFYYEPFPNTAYNSIITINNFVLFGSFIRNIHHWSGVFLVITIFLHLLRVFFTGAYMSSRALNWIIGVFLLILVLLSNFTGYLLPWDQLAYWAITVSTNIVSYIPLLGEFLQHLILRGNEVSGETLIFFYSMHTSFLPFTIFILMLFHFWRVRKAGGIMVPEKEKKSTVPTVPNLVYREMVVGLVLIAIIFFLAAISNAPLMDKANPAFSPNPVKAPWYFSGFQELLMHFHPLFASFIIPLIILILMLILPYFKKDIKPNGEWFDSAIGFKTTLISSATALLFTIFAVVLNEFVFTSGFPVLGLSPIFANGLLPFIFTLLIIWGILFIFKKRYQISTIESFQVVASFLITGFIVLSVINIFFRGENMALTLSQIFN